MIRKPAVDDPKARWEAAIKELPQRDNISFDTISGRKVDELYTPDDLTPELAEELGYPGQFPFTRGVHANLYRGRLWTMRQFAGFGTADQTNQRFKFLLDKGQGGLSTAFDLPTLMGLDS